VISGVGRTASDDGQTPGLLRLLREQPGYFSFTPGVRERATSRTLRLLSGIASRAQALQLQDRAGLTALALGPMHSLAQDGSTSAQVDVADSGESDTHTGVGTWKAMLRFRSRMCPKIFEEKSRIELLAINRK
jgi:hypothetical protein